MIWSTFTKRTGIGVFACAWAVSPGYNAILPLGYLFASELTACDVDDDDAAVGTLVWDWPVMRPSTVVQGARMTSSWSLPIMLAPLRERTPVTWHETLFSRT